MEELGDGHICHEFWSVQLQCDMNDAVGQEELGSVSGGVLLFHITTSSR